MIDGIAGFLNDGVFDGVRDAIAIKPRHQDPRHNPGLSRAKRTKNPFVLNGLIPSGTCHDAIKNAITVPSSGIKRPITHP